MSSKANGGRNDRYSVTESREGTAADAHSQYPMSHDGPSKPMPSFVTPTPPSPSIPLHRHPYSPAAQSATPEPYSRHTSLPSIAALTGPHTHPTLSPAPHPPHHVRLNHPYPSNYRPLSAEDRRVLSSFRVVL